MTASQTRRSNAPGTTTPLPPMGTLLNNRSPLYTSTGYSPSPSGRSGAGWAR